MKPEPRPCPMCGDPFDKPMQVEVCGTCFQDLHSTGAVALHATAEFAPLTPTGAAELVRVRQSRVRAHTGDPELICTWCQKPRQAVRKLLSSGDAHICNECVALCADVLQDELGEDWR